MLRRACAWNQKYLDYEIETTKNLVGDTTYPAWDLKSKVSRLRDWNSPFVVLVKFGSQRLEIKSISITRLKRHCGARIEFRSKRAWNQKYLDYEIETKQVFIQWCSDSQLEIKSISITRLKLSCVWSRHQTFHRLEIKSISITRLKLQRDKCLGRSRCPWNQKYLDYEIET